MTKLNRGMAVAAALLLAACGGESRDAAAAPAEDSTLAQPVTDPAGASAPSVSLPVEVTSRPAPSPEPAPSRADSLAAAAEDVSPEWKQRERSMSSYAQCMRQAQGGDAALRPRLEEACSRLSDAPK